MTPFPQETISELLLAMDSFKSMAQILISKLIAETDQPEKEKIREGHYYEIQNAHLFNGSDTLSENWYFEIHGEHCLFENTVTGQTLEVSLGDTESTGNLDPYFFYQFIKTTASTNHLADNFKTPFGDMLAFFEALKDDTILVHVYGNEFRKL
ncbi:MAG: hypothetical protein ABI850_16050 [Flavobacterium sp.]